MNYNIYIYLIVMLLLIIPLVFTYIVRDKPILPEFWFNAKEDLVCNKIVYLLIIDPKEHSSHFLYAKIVNVEISRVFDHDVYKCTLNNGYMFTTIDCGNMPEFFPYFECKTNDGNICECHFSEETLKERDKTYSIFNYNELNPKYKFSYMNTFLGDDMFRSNSYFYNKIEDL